MSFCDKSPVILTISVSVFLILVSLELFQELFRARLLYFVDDGFKYEYVFIKNFYIY